MSTSTMEELIAQFPPFTPHRLCNPLYCKNKNLKTPSLAKAIEIEEVLLKFFQENRLNSIILCISPSKDILEIPRLLAESVAKSTNSNIHSTENKKVLENFKINLNNQLEAALVVWKERSLDSLAAVIHRGTANFIDQKSKSPCLCSAVEPATLRSLQSYYEDRKTDPELPIQELVLMILGNESTFLEYHSQIKLAKKWNGREIKKFTFDIASIIRNVFQIALADHGAMIYFKLHDRLVGGVAMLEYGRVMNVIRINYPSSVPTIPFSVEASVDTCLAMEENSALSTPVSKSLPGWLNAMKELGDGKAQEKKYQDSIGVYTQINTLPAIDNSVKLNSLTNCAAIRLRISESEPWQLPYAIMDCTFALEIDPNHGKALFRRGLALALLKKWDEAIVDFQRAVELDSRSPAAKELAVALRQVGRRIEA